MKLTLAYSNNVSGIDVDVTTDASMVSSRRNLLSDAQRDLALELTRNALGATSIDSTA